MSRLEEKLAVLGYRKRYEPYFYKEITLNSLLFCIYIFIEDNKIFVAKMSIADENIAYPTVETQQDIDNIQQAFNEMQKDFEVLKKYE